MGVIGQVSVSCATYDLGSQYFPTPKTGRKINIVPEALQNFLFFTELCALDKFEAAVSTYRHCSTEGCKGLLVPVQVERSGLGGGARVEYMCSGCRAQHPQFDSIHLHISLILAGMLYQWQLHWHS